MGDDEGADFFWESLFSPEKRKSKKDSKRSKKHSKHKNTAMNTNENFPREKKKKKLKSKEVSQANKKKQKRKKKNKLALDLEDSSTFTRGSCTSSPIAKPEASHLSSNMEKLQSDCLIQDSKKKTKRKKKVAFDLSSDYVLVKHPKLVSSSPHSLKEGMLLEKESVRGCQMCSQDTETEWCQGQKQNNDSRCTEDDINSQDLFITQKTLRVSSSDPSSDEASDNAIVTTPQIIKRCERELHDSLEQIKQYGESDKKSNQHPRKTNKKLQQPQVLITREAEKRGLLTANMNRHTEEWCFETQREINKGLSEGKNTCPFYLQYHAVNPYLNKQFGENSSQDVQLAPPCSRHMYESKLLPQISTVNASSQTENFFNTEFSSYLNFCQKSTRTVCSEDLKPLDLSLPQRARKGLSSCLPVIEVKDEERCSDNDTSSFSGETKGDSSTHQSCLATVKAMEMSKKPCGGQPWSVRANEEATPSPQSESEPKSTDMTDCQSNKVNLPQVKAVQMRLNECFFFKIKGEGDSPRPESPLIKLAQSREMRSRKSH